MKRLALAIALFLMPSLAWSQGYCPSFATAARVITTLPYTVGSGDFCSLLIFNTGTQVGVINLPAPGTAFIPTGYTVSVKNESSGGLISINTLVNPLTFYDPQMDQAQPVPGVSPLLPIGGSLDLYNNGTDWFSIGFNVATGPISITALQFGTTANPPTLQLDGSNNLLYVNGPQGRQYVALTNISTNLNLSTTKFTTTPGYLRPTICQGAPIGSNQGPPEWFMLTDPLGYTHSIPLC